MNLNSRWRQGHLVLGKPVPGKDFPLIPDTEEDAGAYALVSVADTVILKAYNAKPRTRPVPVWERPHDPRLPWDPCLYLLGGEPKDGLTVKQMLKLLDESEAAIKKAMQKPTIDSTSKLLQKKRKR